MSTFKIGQYTVEVGAHVVSATSDSGTFHNSNVDYYRNTAGGYGLGGDDEAIAMLYAAFCEEWDTNK